MDTILNENSFLYPVKMPLTEKEMLAYTDELTALDTKEKDIHLKHEGEKTAYKNQIKVISQSQKKLLHLLKTKEEVKQIPCFNDFNYFDGIVEVKRIDNEETVTTRKMTADEYQQNLPLERSVDLEND
jgi:hypothetical protein